MALPVNKFTNRATAKLAADVASNDTALTVEVGAGEWFPNPTAPDYFRVVVQKGTSQTDQREYMVCTSRAGDVLTVTRAQEGTPAAAFTTGDEVSLVATATSLDEFVQKAGLVMKGALEVEADPVTPMGVATRQMVVATAFPEAPVDGESYARKDAAWMLLGDAAGAPLPIPISAGGTGGADLAAAQTNLYIPVTTFDDLEPATKKYGDRWIRPGNMTELVWAPNAGGGGAGIWINPADAASEAYPISVDKGGTGATTAAQARINLGITNAASQFILGDGTVAAPGLAWASEPGLGWFRSSASFARFAAQGTVVESINASDSARTLKTLNPRAASGSAEFLAWGNADGAASAYGIGMGVNASGQPFLSERVFGSPASPARVLQIGFSEGVLVSGGGVKASRFDLDTFPSSWYQDATQVYFHMAADWRWNYVKATGQLIWRHGPSNLGTSFNPNGDFTIGRDLYLNNGNVALINSVPAERYLRFSADGWRWRWITADGRLEYASNAGATLFSINAGGSIDVIGNATVRDGNIVLNTATGSTIHRQGHIIRDFSTSGATIFANVADATPGGMQQLIQMRHSPGVTADISLLAGTGTFRFQSTGEAWKSSAGTAWLTGSDERLKDILGPYQYGLDEILALEPMWYRYKDQPDAPPGVNVVAQRAREVIPEMVFVDWGHPRSEELGGTLAVQADFAWFAMLNAIKTLHQRLSQLEKA